MKKLLIALLVLLVIPFMLYADSKVSDLGENAAPITTDIFYIVDNPGGTASGQKVTLSNMFGAGTDIDDDGEITWGNLAAGELADNTVDSDDFVHEDWGEVTNATGSVVIDDSVTVTGWTMGASVATTPAEGDNDTSLATTAYVIAETADILDGTDAFTDFNGADIIDSDNYNAGSIDLEHMASQSVDSDNIKDDEILEADLNVDEVVADNDILTFDTTGDNFSWQTPTELGIVTTEADPDLDDDNAVTVGDDTTSGIVVTWDGSAGTDGTITWDEVSDVFALNGGLMLGGNFKIPSTDGTANQILKTDGSGTVTWQADTGGSGSGDLLADGTVPMTANWDIGNYDITLKALTGDGTIEGATLTEGGNAVSNDTEIEAVVEPLIDTLANLTSIQSVTVTLADAGADAFFGWDDVGGAAYENLTAAEALAIVGGAANDFDGSGDVTVAIADISDLGSNVGTFLGTPSSANFASAVTDETGVDEMVFASGPVVTLGENSTIPNNVTVDSLGEISIGANDDQLHYYGVGERVLSYKKEKSVFVENPTNGDHIPLWKTLDPITVTKIHCACDPFGSSESVNINLMECDSTADNCATVDDFIVCDNDGATDDGTLANSSIDANDWMTLEIGQTQGTVSGVVVTWYYTIDVE